MKKTLQNIVLVGSAFLAGLAADEVYESYRPRKASEESVAERKVAVVDVKPVYSLEEKAKTSQEDYVPTLEDFKKVLGDRYMPEREEELREFWKRGNVEESFLYKRLFYNIYKNPSINSFVSTLRDVMGNNISQKKLDWTLDLYKDFNPDSITKEKYNEYLSRFPWRIIKTGSNFNEADKLMLFYNRWFDECMSNVAAEWFAKQLVDYAIMPMLEEEKEKNKK